MARLKGECAQMMQALGPTIVGLTVWNLHHAVKGCQVDEALAQAGQEPASAPGLGGGVRVRSIVCDVDALNQTKELLHFYYKQLQDGSTAWSNAGRAGSGQGAHRDAARGDALAGHVQGGGATGAPSAAAAGAGMSSTMAAPVMAPPPPAQESVDASVDAPLALDALEHTPQQDASSAVLQEPAVDAESEAGVDPREMLEYDLEDVMHLINIINRLLEAHKATQEVGAADKTRVLAQKLAVHKVDLHHGLRERLAQRSLARPELAHGALLSWLALSPLPHGFLARACGYGI